MNNIYQQDSVPFGAKKYLNKDGVGVLAMRWSGFNSSEMSDFSEVAVKKDKPFTLRNGDVVLVDDYVINMTGYLCACIKEVFNKDYSLMGAVEPVELPKDDGWIV